MNKKNFAIAITLVLFLSFDAFSQKKTTEAEVAVNELIKGTLFTPEKTSKKTCLVVLIAGSGPTDRNGNQMGMPNNSLRFLAQGLAQNDIAVYSYDKRILAPALAGKIDEKTLSFNDFITDATAVIAFFKAKKEYAKIIVAGHSEGALIGMVASANNNADAYISLAGAGRPIDDIIIDQVAAQMPAMREETAANFGKLRKGEDFQSSPVLMSIFHESVRPYLLSWMKYNPQEEIGKLTIPVLIVNGTKDLQVKVAEAELLKKAKPNAKLVILENMNHVFKEIKGDDTENIQAYKNPDLPVLPELVSTVNQFIKSL
jgi:pimeloyl-ACP methyl ester carboxylesterase